MLTTLTAIVGLVIGVIGLTLSILNYLRDKPHIIVSLRWDVEWVTPQETPEPIRLGRIYVTNTGRRPVFLTSVGLEFQPQKHRYIVTRPVKTNGYKLNEGDSPVIITLNEIELVKHLSENARYWKEFRAFAIDSRGTKYLSKKVNHRPSWGAGEGKADTKEYIGSIIWELVPDSEVGDEDASSIILP